jgi:hypothetical protein
MASRCDSWRSTNHTHPIRPKTLVCAEQEILIFLYFKQVRQKRECERKVTRNIIFSKKKHSRSLLEEGGTLNAGASCLAILITL